MPTAPDGTVFEDRREYKKYMMAQYYSFKNRSGETLVKKSGEIDGQPFELEALRDCEVLLLDHMDQAQLDDLQNCKVFVGASSASVYVRQCRNCVFTVACQQLRVLESHDCTFNLLSKTDPSIELSEGLVFGPFNGAYPELSQHLAAAGLDPQENRWSAIYDWNDPDKTEAHFRRLGADEMAETWCPAGPAENPVPAGAAEFSSLPSDNGGAFEIVPPQPAPEDAASANADTGAPADAAWVPTELVRAGLAGLGNGESGGGGDSGGGGGGGEEIYSAAESSAGAAAATGDAGAATAFGGEGEGQAGGESAYYGGGGQEPAGGYDAAGLAAAGTAGTAEDESSMWELPAAAPQAGTGDLPSYGMNGSYDMNGNGNGGETGAAAAWGAADNGGEIGEIGYGAAASSVTDPFSGAEFPALVRQNKAFEDAVAARKQKEVEAKQTALKRAEEELDAFYDQRTDRTAHRQSINQEHEEHLQQAAEELDSMSESNPWAKVCALVDLKLRGGDEESEFSVRDRMRSLLIQMKADGAAKGSK